VFRDGILLLENLRFVTEFAASAKLKGRAFNQTLHRQSVGLPYPFDRGEQT
jgi:hypothetical protein